MYKRGKLVRGSQTLDRGVQLSKIKGKRNSQRFRSWKRYKDLALFFCFPASFGL